MNVKPLNMQHFTASGVMKLSLISLFFLLQSTVFPQSYGEIGIFGGGSYYVGDLNPEKHFLMTKPAFGAFARHNFNERLALKVAATYGQIKGDDIKSGYYPDRMLNFSSSVTDLSATFEINFFEYFIGSLRHYFTPYMFGGGGLVLFNPKGRYDGNSYELQPLGTEGQGSALYPERKPYSKMAFHIPFGIGFKYSLNDFIGVSLHWSLQKTFTDYLDDVSTTYYLDLKDANPGEVSIEQALSDPSFSHTNGMQRGNSQNNDWYSFAGISVSLKVNYFNNKKCLNTFL